MTTGITSYGYSPPGGVITPNVAWANWQKCAGARYMVDSPDDAVVSPVTGGTRQVQVGTGFVGGQGVLDEITAAQTVDLPEVVSGVRYFLIKVTRTWQTVQATSITYQDVGTSLPAGLPALTNTQPGVIDDQPLALVSVSVSGGSTVTAVVKDLRAIGGPNFFVMQDGLDQTWFSYLAAAGVTVHCGDVVWRRLLDSDTGNLIWQRNPRLWSGAQFVSTATAPGWSGGGVTTLAMKSGNEVELYIELRRTGAAISSGPTGNVSDQPLASVTVQELRPTHVVDFTMRYLDSGAASRSAAGTIDEAGNITLFDMTPNSVIPTSTDSSRYSVRMTIKYSRGA